MGTCPMTYLDSLSGFRGDGVRIWQVHEEVLNLVLPYLCLHCAGNDRNPR